MTAMIETTAAEDVNLVDLMNTRARSYGMLGRLFREEIDLATLRELQQMRFPQATGNAAVDEGYHQLYDYLKRAWDDSVTELAIDYVSTFIGHGVNGYSAAYPYESVYTSDRGIMMQEAYTSVARAYREQALAKDPAFTEPEDHLAVELAFMAHLIECELAVEAAEEIAALREAQAAFYGDHLGRWASDYVQDALSHARTDFFLGLLMVGQALLEREDAHLRTDDL